MVSQTPLNWIYSASQTQLQKQLGMFFIIFGEENIMTKTIAFFLLGIWLLSVEINCGYLTPSKNATFILNNNLVLNGNISSPVIAPSSFWNYFLTQGNWSSHGFFVQFVDACLILSSFSQLCSSLTGVTCGWQFLDADSTQSNEQYYQKFSMSTKGEYQLKFDWITVKPNLASNGLSVMWNGVAIDSFYDASCYLQTSTYYVTSILGVNELGFKGIGTADSWGVMIRNIRLQLVIYNNATVTPNITNSSSSAKNASANANNSSSSGNNFNNGTNTNSINSTSTNFINSDNTTYNYSSNSSQLTSNSSNFSSNFTDMNSTNSSSFSQNTSSNFTNSFNSSTNNSINDTNSNNSTTIQDSNSTISNDSNIQNETNPPSSDFEPSNNTDAFIPIDFNTLLMQLNATEYKRIAQVIGFFNNFEANKIMNELSATKRTTKFIMGFAIEFNHFVFYNFHIRNYTIMANLILSGIQALDDQKGSIIDQYIYPIVELQPTQIVKDYNYGLDILPVNLNNLIPDFVRRSNGFVLDCMDFVFFQLPLTLVIYLLGCLLFRLLFHLRASMLFRQYSIVGYFFVILLDGKVESYTFFFLTQVKLMPSVDLTQKMGITAMMIFYFGVLLYSISSMLLFQSLYRKLTKYLYENCAGELRSAFILFVSVGPYNILLGTVHCLLLNYPNAQILILFLIELCYFIFQLYLCFSAFFESKVKVIVQLLMSFIRIVFQISFFLYDWLEMSYDFQISVLQQYMYFSFLGCWGLSSLLLFYEKARLIWLIIKNSTYRKNSVLPVDEQQQRVNNLQPNLPSFRDEQGKQIKSTFHRFTRKAQFAQTFKGLRSQRNNKEKEVETNMVVSKQHLKRQPIVQLTFRSKQSEHQTKQLRTKEDRTVKLTRNLNKRLQCKTIF